MGRATEPKDENARIREFIELDKGTLPPDGGPGFNRLIFASSPYLLQHADNPVDWYQWGDEAFERALRENKPVFLSIGYATCHWCHVMAHESFADPEVAQVLNRTMVAVKVDREERPDIDAQYMLVSQLLTGRGGWPLNVIMTPDRKPFFVATYLPKQARQGLPGIIELLTRVDELWQARGDQVRKDSEALLAGLRRMAVPRPGPLPGRETLDNAYREFAGMYDPVFGGFGEAPKFPMPLTVSFLVRHWSRSGTDAAREMVEETLRRMRAGGVWDQLGSGIHRYSVDREWLAPHFEKMLYDQALVAMAYLDAWQAFGEPDRLKAAEEIFSFVLREMTAPSGGFYSGLDADSEGEEGTFYLWTPGQVEEVLGAETGRIFCQAFDITEPGNFEGRNIPRLKRPPELLAEALGTDAEQLAILLDEARERLFLARDGRIRPFRDEKVLAGWNGLMIAALARAAGISGNERYLAAAGKAARFVLHQLRDSGGRLFRSHHLGEASVPAFLEDYAFLGWGLIELYCATGEPEYLDEALRLSLGMIGLFGDQAGGGFFETGADAEQVLARMKRAYDDVTPSGNSVAAMNLLRLGRILSDDFLVREGERCLEAFLPGAARQPSGFPHLLSAWDFLTGDPLEITLVFREQGAELREMVKTLCRRYLPNLVLRYVPEGEDVEGRTTVDGRAVAWICARGACLPPAAGPEELAERLSFAI